MKKILLLITILMTFNACLSSNDSSSDDQQAQDSTAILDSLALKDSLLILDSLDLDTSITDTSLTDTSLVDTTVVDTNTVDSTIYDDSTLINPDSIVIDSNQSGLSPEQAMLIGTWDAVLQDTANQIRVDYQFIFSNDTDFLIDAQVEFLGFKDHSQIVGTYTLEGDYIKLTGGAPGSGTSDTNILWLRSDVMPTTDVALANSYTGSSSTLIGVWTDSYTNKHINTGEYTLVQEELTFTSTHAVLRTDEGDGWYEDYNNTYTSTANTFIIDDEFGDSQENTYHITDGYLVHYSNFEMTTMVKR